MIAAGLAFVVFAAIAIVGIVLLVASAFFADDIDAAPEVEWGGSGFLSLRSIAVFLTAFGTVGAIASLYKQPPLASSVYGLLSGLMMSGLYVLAMRVVRSQQASSLIEDEELVGLIGRVTVPIPAEGLGEVSCQLKAQSTRRLARSKSHQAIPEGAMVRIVEMQGDVAVVERLS